MSRYCPTCFCEFTDDLASCPTHHKTLLKKRPEIIKKLVDLYVAADIMEAERIVEILEEHDILARESTAGVSQVPANDTRYLVCVEEEHLSSAKKLIEQAQSDGVVSKTGAFL